MTPQSLFTVMAPVVPEREGALRALLASMNTVPGRADPRNPILPFGEFAQLHTARLVLLDNDTMGDLTLHGLPRVAPAHHLVLMGDCDGPAHDCLADLAARAGPGLRRLFAHCERFDPQGDLLGWMRAHDCPAAAAYVHRRGRTVRQVREEHALRLALAARVPRRPLASGPEAQQLRRELIAFIDGEVRAGRLTLSPPLPTPPAWRTAHLLNLVAIPLLGLLALPFLVLALPLLAAVLRMHEKRDPEFCPRPASEAIKAMQRIEDHDFTNQFSSSGPVKPGPFRRWLLVVLLALLDYTCRHIFYRGALTRVQTIHFARWVLVDHDTRVVFCTTYDGGHEAYMDDFINKAGWGLNLLFSNGVGWPRTDWLLKGGSRHELRFKRYQRRHQQPSQVWYKAYPGLTLTDLERGGRIRAGLERQQMSDAEALAWLRML